jgi:hypothetical protein
MFRLATNFICICYCHALACSNLIAQQKFIMGTVDQCIYIAYAYLNIQLCDIPNKNDVCRAERCFIRMKNSQQTHTSAETQCLIVYYPCH